MVLKTKNGMAIQTTVRYEIKAISLAAGLLLWFEPMLIAGTPLLRAYAPQIAHEYR